MLSVIQVQTNFTQVDPTHFVINIPEADSINHLVVFLTGAIPFPDGFGGSGNCSVKACIHYKYYFFSL